MSPITAKATHRRVLSYHIQQLAMLLNSLDQGLRIAGIDPEYDRQHLDMVATLKEMRYKLESLGKETCAITSAFIYLDSRGLTP